MYWFKLDICTCVHACTWFNWLVLNIVSHFMKVDILILTVLFGQKWFMVIQESDQVLSFIKDHCSCTDITCFHTHCGQHHQPSWSCCAERKPKTEAIWQKKTSSCYRWQLALLYLWDRCVSNYRERQQILV